MAIKKCIRVLLLVIIMIATTLPALIATSESSAVASQDIRVVLNGREVEFPDQKAIIIQGRTLVPVRFVTEALGATVEWIEATNSVIIRFGTQEILLRVGSRQVSVAGKMEEIDVPAQIVGGRTMVPLRFVSEIMGAQVEWDDLSSSVLIHSVPPEEPPPAVLEPGEIFAKVSPAVVMVEALDANDYLMNLGSGFIVQSDGRVVTNFHVIEKAHSLRITTADGQELMVVAVVSQDIDRNLAVLQVDGKELPIVQLGNSSEVRTGARVFAIGNPLGLQNTLSEGLISNHQRLFNGQSYLQISVPISPGSSGGVLVNELGAVIGVTLGGFVGGQNLNLAIPIDDVRRLLKRKTETVISTVFPVESVTLLQSLRLQVGVTRKLVATVLPSYATSGAVTWTTSNASVASVDAAGLVTAKSLGTAQITVTTVDGGKQAICTVTVVSPAMGEGSYVVDNTMGNTPGNSVNRGSVVQKDGWLYYFSWDYSEDIIFGALLRERLDGTGRTVIVRDISSNINVVGEWVYYTNADDFSTLYKVRTDGSGRTKLNDDTCTNVVVSGDWIYYISIDNDARIYRIGTNGEGREKITQERCSDGFVVVDGWIYYSSWGLRTTIGGVTLTNLSSGLRKMRTDGTDNTLLNNAGFSTVSDGEWIYFTDSQADLRVYKIKLDGTGKAMINNSVSVNHSMNIMGDWIFYSSRYDNNALFKMRTDGTENTQLTTHPVYRVNLTEEWVYYNHGTQTGPLYRIRTDGTDNQEISRPPG